MKVGIIGAGTMGQGIAKAFAQVDGYEVALCDIDQAFADNGLKKIAAGYAKLVAKGKLDQEKVDAILARIKAGLKEGRLCQARCEGQTGSGKSGCHPCPHQSRTQGRSLRRLRPDR